MILSTELLIYKIILTTLNVGLVTYFIERLIKKFLPHLINNFRILNLVVVILFIASTFIANTYLAFFHSIVALNILQYEIFYLFYKKYKLHIFSFMNQFLFFSVISMFSLVLFFQLEYLLIFIFISLVLTSYSAYMFYYIKMAFYKIYLTIFIICMLLYIVLFGYVVFNPNIKYINLILESFYVVGLTGIIISFRKREKMTEDAKPVKEHLRVLMTEHTLLTLKHDAEKAHKSIDDYLETLIRDEMKK